MAVRICPFVVVFLLQVCIAAPPVGLSPLPSTKAKNEWQQWAGNGPFSPADLTKVAAKVKEARPGIDRPPPAFILLRLQRTVESANRDIEAATAGEIDEALKASERKVKKADGSSGYVFHSASGKSAAITRRERFAAVAASIHRVVSEWSAPGARPLHPESIKGGDEGPISWGVVVRRIVGPREMIVTVRQDGRNLRQVNLHDYLDVIVRGYPTKDMADGKAFILEGTFKVKGTEKSDCGTLFVLERTTR